MPSSGSRERLYCMPRSCWGGGRDSGTQSCLMGTRCEASTLREEQRQAWLVLAPWSTVHSSWHWTAFQRRVFGGSGQRAVQALQLSKSKCLPRPSRSQRRAGSMVWWTWLGGILYSKQPQTSWKRSCEWGVPILLKLRSSAAYLRIQSSSDPSWGVRHYCWLFS